MFLSVVMIDWGNLRGQIFSRTGFAPSGRGASVPFGALAEAAGVGRCKVALVVCLGVVWRGAAAAPALLGHVARRYF